MVLAGLVLMRTVLRLCILLKHSFITVKGLSDSPITLQEMALRQLKVYQKHRIAVAGGLWRNKRVASNNAVCGAAIRLAQTSLGEGLSYT